MIAAPAAAFPLITATGSAVALLTPSSSGAGATVAEWGLVSVLGGALLQYWRVSRSDTAVSSAQMVEALTEIGEAKASAAAAEARVAGMAELLAAQGELLKAKDMIIERIERDSP